jgi:hypothetical protein
MKMSERANWTRWAVSLVVTLAISGGVSSCAFRDRVLKLEARQDLLEEVTKVKLDNIAESVKRIEGYTRPSMPGTAVPAPVRP